MADVTTPEDVSAAFAAVSGEAVLAVQRLSGGWGHPSWRVTTAGGTYAVRLYNEGYPAYGQAKLLTYLAQQGFPVPEVAFVGMHGEAHVLALGWLEGVTVAEALRARPDRAEPLGRTFGEVHAQLHAVPVLPEMRGAFWSAEPRERANRALVVLHLDYHLLNVMTDGDTVTGVIDWENVRLGDARCDAARTLSILCADPAIRALPKAQRQMVRAFRRGYLEGYRHRAGAASLDALAPFLESAGGFMLRDLAGRLGPPAAWTIQRWSRRWSHR